MNNYIFLLLGIFLLFLDIIVIAYLPDDLNKNIIIAILSFFMGIIGFNLKEFILEIKKKRNINIACENIRKKFNNYFKDSIILNKLNKNDEIIKSEDEIIYNYLKDQLIEDNQLFNSIILCYFCKKWKETNKPNDYEIIKRYAENLGIKYFNLDKEIKLFLTIYNSLILQKLKLENNIDNNLYFKDLLISFSNEYYKELQFFEIKEELNQSKNLHDTLIKIIKEGKLSSYGITNESLKKLEFDIRKRLDYSKTFLIIGNKLSDNVKNYLTLQPGFTGCSLKTRHINKRGIFSAFIVKPQELFPDAKALLKKLKLLNKTKSESTIWVIPLDLINCELYTLPSNQSFKTKNMKDGYEAISWFRVGYEYSDSFLWNEINKSTITSEKLLALIPFNIFCPGILPCEQEFIIKNYDKIKNKFNVNTLSDWKDKNENLLVSYLIEIGLPNYSKEEFDNIIKTDSINIDKQKIKDRLLTLSKQIIDGAKKFDRSININPKGEDK